MMADPAMAGNPPSKAEYQGIFSPILTLRSRFKSNSLSSPLLFLLIDPIHFIFAAFVSIKIGEASLAFDLLKIKSIDYKD